MYWTLKGLKIQTFQPVNQKLGVIILTESAFEFANIDVKIKQELPKLFLLLLLFFRVVVDSPIDPEPLLNGAFNVSR